MSLSSGRIVNLYEGILLRVANPGLWGEGQYIVICGYMHIVREAHSKHAKHALFLGGLGACPPNKNLKNRYCEIKSGGIF